MEIKRFDSSSLENISKVIGTILTGSEITKMFSIIGDIHESPLDQKIAKWKRIDAACHSWQNIYNCGNKVVQMIEYVMNPVRFVNNPESYDSLRKEINLILTFSGLTLHRNGKIYQSSISTTITEAQEKIDYLKAQLTIRNIHPKIIKFCNTDIIKEDYLDIFRIRGIFLKGVYTLLIYLTIISNHIYFVSIRRHKMI